MARYPKRKKKVSLKGKSYKNPYTALTTDKQTLRNVFIHDCFYDADCRPVCPVCGQYYVSVIYSKKNSQGLYEYICNCLTPYCRTVFKRPKELRGD